MADGKKDGEEFALGCGTLLMLLIGSCAIWAIVTTPSSKQTTAATQVVLWSGEDGAPVTPLSTLQKGAHIKAYDTSDDEKWVRISEYAEATSQAEWIRADHVADASPEETMYVSARRLNVRARPTTEAETNEQLEQGEEVTIFEITSDGWARISSLEGVPGQRTADWIFAKHLSPDPVEPLKPVQTADKQEAQTPEKQEIYISSVVDAVCGTLIDQGLVTECYSDLNVTTANWMVVRLNISVAEASSLCHGIVRNVTKLAKNVGAKDRREWQVRVYTPFTGEHPIATCWMYRQSNFDPRLTWPAARLLTAMMCFHGARSTSLSDTIFQSF